MAQKHDDCSTNVVLQRVLPAGVLQQMVTGMLTQRVLLCWTPGNKAR